MKFSTALTSLILIVPLLAGEAFGAAAVGRAGFGKGGKGGNKGAGAGAKGASTSSAAAAASTSAAASAANNSSSAAAASNSTVLANNGAGAGSGSGNATANNPDVQNSLTLDPKVIATGFEQNGQETPAAGQVASLTSSNNFINFCATVPNLPITNGQQIKTGSCNPAPMGIIAATTNMPSSKFVTPVNGQNVAAANTAFPITFAINNLETGNFVNADSNYYSAPQQVNSAGTIIGHSHITVQAIDSFTSTTPLDPNKFAFFKGVNQAATNGQLTEQVTAGLPAGSYRVCTINTDANHTPALVAVAQHGFLDDCVYFSVGGNGNDQTFGAGAGAAANNATGANNAAAGSNSTAAATSSTAASASAAASSAASSAAAGKGAAGKGAAQGGNKGNVGKGGRKGAGRRFRLGGRESRLGRDY